MNGLALFPQLVHKYFVSGWAFHFHFFLLHLPWRSSLYSHIFWRHLFTSLLGSIPYLILLPYNSDDIQLSSLTTINTYICHLSRHTSCIDISIICDNCENCPSAHLPPAKITRVCPFRRSKESKNISTFHQNTQLCSEEPDSRGCL